jgi:hypothetical protein
MTIFLRSFLTFWIATVLIISISFGLVLMTHHLNRVPPVSVPLPDLQACLQTTIQARSTRRFAQAAKECRLVYILDPSRTELLSSDDSLAARSLAAEVTPGSPLRLEAFRNEVMVAFDTTINNGPHQFSGGNLLWPQWYLRSHVSCSPVTLSTPFASCSAPRNRLGGEILVRGLTLRF